MISDATSSAIPTILLCKRFDGEIALLVRIDDEKFQSPISEAYVAMGKIIYK